MQHHHTPKNLSEILYEYGLLGVENTLITENTTHLHNQTNETHDDKINDEPVVKFVHRLLADAIHQRVSDIHLEPSSTCCRIRFRSDGILHETALLPTHFSNRIITRLKILANLDIAEKRLPQDGRFHFNHQHPIDIRLSTCPGLHGETIVLRLLPRNARQLPLDTLGMTNQQLQYFHDALTKPQGLIIVTGPTGSGKTSTLYAALQLLNHTEKNILSAEDPVEIEIPGITQVNVNPRIGLHFATILRAFLRQDPDIMMIGEIRDKETAAIAVQAAQTGHLVLATLHANSAADTIKRLLTLNITPTEIAGSLLLLSAQRLIRTLCKHCPPLTGCINCRNGYSGRTGIFEIIPISQTITQLLLAKANLADIEKQFHLDRHETLYECGLSKVKAGLTTEAELLRITGESLHALT